MSEQNQENKKKRGRSPNKNKVKSEYIRENYCKNTKCCDCVLCFCLL